jgi:superfamily I DNA and/or RNA helicase
MKKKGAGARRINLENGKSVDLQGDNSGYQFSYDGNADLFEGSNITVFIGGGQSYGHVVSVMGEILIISINDDYGSNIHACTIQIDNTNILESLNESLLEVQEGKKQNFNKDLASQVVTNTNSEKPSASSDQIEGLSDLNNEQRESVLKALSNEVLYLWGPPGTGKTKTLGVLIRALFDDGKKVLVCSNTNQAVDQILLKLCTELGRSHKALQDGNVLRIGSLTHDELKANWSEYITLEGIVERKSEDLLEKKSRLISDISKVNRAIDSFELVIKSFERLDELDVEVTKQNEIIAKGNQRLDKKTSDILRIENEIKSVQDEYDEYQKAGAFRRVIMRSESKIIDTKNSLQTLRQRLSIELKELDAGIASAPKLLEKLRVAMAQVVEIISGKKKSNVEADLKRVQKEKKIFTDELSVINKKLEDIAKSVMDEALIIGATVTKAFISSKQLPLFDAVVVDEASMVMLPAVYYVSGLACERVVISGDFRQLAPIVPTVQEETEKAIGRDIFDVSGITKAVGSKTDVSRLVMLNKQYRMNSDICDLISESMYGGLLKTVSDQKASSNIPSLFSNSLTIVDTSSIWPFANRDKFKSRYNLMHALAIRNLCFHLKEKDYLDKAGKLGVCTPYAAQAKLLKKILNTNGLETIVDTGTVHRYQGDEKETMILDIPDSLGEQNVGIFLQSDHPDENGAKLFNVAVSRAKNHLIVFANLTYLEDKLPDLSMLREILHTIQSKGKVIDVRDILSMYPIMNDLKKIGEAFDLKRETVESGLFKQSDFDKVFLSDLRAANKSIVIFSGFITPQRVGVYIDTFRLKINEGVAIRCITRPPSNNAVSAEQSREALDALEAIGCVVDTRWSIHQKIIIIDEKILWYGSLNPLSHTSRTDEIMSRIDNPEAAIQMGMFVSLNIDGAKEGSCQLTMRENKICPACESRTTYRTGRYGPYWSCENCDWSESLNNSKSGKSKGVNVSPADLPKQNHNCPLCKKVMLLRNGPYGSFYSCSAYPKCKGKKSLSRGTSKTKNH